MMTDERIAGSFWLSEFLRSDIAVRRGLDNVPKAPELANIRNMLAPGMQRVRDTLGVPVLNMTTLEVRAADEYLRTTCAPAAVGADQQE